MNGTPCLSGDEDGRTCLVASLMGESTCSVCGCPAARESVEGAYADPSDEPSA